MSLAKADQTFLAEKWKWRWTGGLPFDPRPPLDHPDALSQYFVGRASELESAFRTVFYGRNLMVRGSWGIGKTAFILTLLQRLVSEADAVGESLLPVYLGAELPRVDLDQFYRGILYALAKALAREDAEARRVLEALVGLRTSRERVGSAKTKVKTGPAISLFVDLEGEVGGGGKRTRHLQIDHPKHFIDQLLTRAHKRYKYKKVVLAVDDLDKTEPREIRTVLDQAKALLRDVSCQFILTGRALVAPSDDFSALVLELFQSPIRLGQLSGKDLKQAAVGQLNLFRKRPDDGLAPFAEEAIGIAAEKSAGIPRLFNRLCLDAVTHALAQKIQAISPDVFEASLAASQTKVAVNVPYEHRRLLYLILSRQGISFYKGAEIDDVLNEAQVGRIWDLLPIMDELIKKDLLYAVEEGGRLVVRVSPLAEQAAELGRTER